MMSLQFIDYPMDNHRLVWDACEFAVLDGERLSGLVSLSSYRESRYSTSHCFPRRVALPHCGAMSYVTYAKNAGHSPVNR